MTDGDTPDLLVAGRYRMVRLVRTDPDSTVWEATDEREDHPVALELLSSATGAAEDHGVVVGRAMRAARLAMRLDHPNAIRVDDVLQHRGEPCLVTELVTAPTLSTRLGTLTEAQAAIAGSQVAAALAAAHTAGIVHGDVSPAEISLVTGGAARIGGFGVARTGTSGYVAPEVAGGGEPGSASDVFSLAATLYASLEGAPPRGPGAAAPRAPTLAPLLSEMTSPDPDARPTMADVADRLERFAAGEGEAALAPAVPATAPAGPRRRVLAILVAAVAVVALAVAGVVLVRQRGDSGPSAAPPPTPSSTTATAATASPPAPTSSAPPSGSSPDASQLAAVVSRFYSFVPSDADAAFDLLTADYQTRVAGGRQAFLRFWSEYSTVSASDVTGTPPGTVTATITYTTKSGQVTRERTTFGVVDDGGALKIGSSTVTGRS